MRYLNLSFDDAAANLACDEALLQHMEADPSADACLRVWQTTKRFVVLGHSKRLFSDVNVSLCNANRVPILRRISGGGTVLQGPGCLNYSLFLRSGARHLKTIGDTFDYVLRRHRLIVNEICGTKKVCIQGISDLAIDGRKFSGNAQYRKSGCLLVHGTFLLDFDLRLIEKFLAVPTQQPAYRKGRPHLQFLTNLNVEATQLCGRLQQAWQANDEHFDVPIARMEALVRDRYQRREWSEKF